MITYEITAIGKELAGQEWQLYQDGVKQEGYSFCHFPEENYIGRDTGQFYRADTLERIKLLVEQNLTTGYIYTAPYPE
jgi:hypothetical protein